MGACFCTGACKRPPYRCGADYDESYPWSDPWIVPITPSPWVKPWASPILPVKPWEPVAPWKNPPWDLPYVRTGWVCSRCGTSNNPILLVCGNQDCKPKDSLKKRVK